MNAALIVLDGWGLREHGPGEDPADETHADGGGRDAVAAAETPAFDRYARAGATGRLRTHGRSVGLPEGQSGNSEVGHLTIGAGRVVRQAYTRIEDAIEGGTFAREGPLADAIGTAAERGSRLHLLGLLSDGGVHADHRHLHALVERAAEEGVEAVTHPFTDGRDTSPTAGEGFLDELERVAADAGTGAPATVTGRYYAMDRDENWERTRRAYDAIVERDGEYEASSGVAAIRESYDRGDTDEFVEPTLVDRGSDGASGAAGDGASGAAGDSAVADGDVVVFCNFRADRARQLTRMLAGTDPVADDPAWPPASSTPDVHLTTLTEYDEKFDLPVAFEPREPGETIGSVLADAGLTQLRIAESEKYAHVTYFLNGGREGAFPGERREIVPSPDVPTYDLQPEMSAPAVTDRAIEIVGAEDPDVLVLNYANPDMVGHTGDFDAAVAAVEAVDEQLGRLVPALRDAGAHVLLTADHGNADDVGTPDDPHTAHTFNTVPFVAIAPEGDADAPNGAAGGHGVRSGGESLPGLRNVAPTLLSLAGADLPGAMTGESLLAD